jgi:hypothetical protein
MTAGIWWPPARREKIPSHHPPPNTPPSPGSEKGMLGLTARFEHRGMEPSAPAPEAFLVKMQEVP